MSPTSPEDFIACERTDRLFVRVLGPTLAQAVLRLVAFGTVGCLALSVIATALI